eukprot:Awhi_evm1s7440
MQKIWFYKCNGDSCLLRDLSVKRHFSEGLKVLLKNRVKRSKTCRTSSLAQSVERWTFNPNVVGSSPTWGYPKEFATSKIYLPSFCFSSSTSSSSSSSSSSSTSSSTLL